MRITAGANTAISAKQKPNLIANPLRQATVNPCRTEGQDGAPRRGAMSKQS